MCVFFIMLGETKRDMVMISNIKSQIVWLIIRVVLHHLGNTNYFHHCDDEQDVVVTPRIL